MTVITVMKEGVRLASFKRNAIAAQSIPPSTQGLCDTSDGCVAISLTHTQILLAMPETATFPDEIPATH
jgi:hypothetical protein